MTYARNGHQEILCQLENIKKSVDLLVAESQEKTLESFVENLSRLVKDLSDKPGERAGKGTNKQDFFKLRARILAELEGMERTEAVVLLASAINEHLAPFHYGATVVTRCLISDGDEDKK